jgi:hypothetical protein
MKCHCLDFPRLVDGSGQKARGRLTRRSGIRNMDVMAE